MTHSRKVELLYNRAKGRASNASPAEQAELRRYHVDFGEGDFYATKSNISAYVTAVDKQGCRISFYDWCMNNNRADRRRKGSSKEDMKKSNRNFSFGLMFVGFITWGFAVMSVLGGMLAPGACFIVGAVISVVIGRASRQASLFTTFMLPIIIGVLASMYL